MLTQSSDFLPGGYPPDQRGVVEFFVEGKTFGSLVPRYRHYPEGTTPLMVAASQNKLRVVEELLSYGASHNSQDIGLYTALHWAAHMGCLDSTSALLGAGADLSAQDEDMMTPLMVACKKSRTSVALLLAELETRKSRVDIGGRNALHHAATDAGCAIFLFLIDRGWDPYLQDRRGDSPICMALQTMRGPWMVCNYGFDLTTLEKPSGIVIAHWPFLSTSAMRMLLKRLPGSLVRLLLENSFEEDLQKREGLSRRPLSLAARAGRTEIMDILINAGADLQSVDPFHGTPLIVASASGKLDAVKLLVRRGAQISVHFPCCFSNAVDAAHATGRENILRWLLVERYIDQRKLANTAEHPEHIIKPWGGICSIDVPSGGRWKRVNGESLWDYVLRIEWCKKAGLLDPLALNFRSNSYMLALQG